MIAQTHMEWVEDAEVGDGLSSTWRCSCGEEFIVHPESDTNCLPSGLPQCPKCHKVWDKIIPSRR